MNKHAIHNHSVYAQQVDSAIIAIWGWMAGMLTELNYLVSVETSTR